MPLVCVRDDTAWAFVCTSFPTDVSRIMRALYSFYADLSNLSTLTRALHALSRLPLQAKCSPNYVQLAPIYRTQRMH